MCYDYSSHNRSHVTSMVELPLTLITTLINAEYRSLDNALKWGYEDNVVWCNLSSSCSNHSQMHLYRWDGDAIWYKQGLITSDWIRRYDVTTKGDYVICTGLGIAISPVATATFRNQRLCSMYTGSPLDSVPQHALVYHEESKVTVIHDNWISSMKHSKEYYYHQGRRGNVECVSKLIKEEYLEGRKNSNIKTALAIARKVLKEGSYQWDELSNLIVKVAEVRIDQQPYYNPEADDFYEEVETKIVPMFSVNFVEVDGGTKITLTGLRKIPTISTITVVDHIDPKLNTEPEIVWNHEQ